jgi:CubicO group peptidase (beta-lactamase class C family)
MRTKILIILLGAALEAMAQVKPCTSNASYVFPRQDWERVQPAQAGWTVEELQAAKQYASTIGSQAWMLVENGKVVDSYGPLDRNNSLHSARKSFMSAMYGQAIADGTIDMAKTLRELAVDDTNPALSPEEKQATIRDLLMARSGVYHVAQGESPGMSAARPKRFSHPHGTFWYYNNWDFNALGTIFNKLTNKSLFDFLAERIATPLGMEDFKRTEQRFFDQGQSVHKYYNFEFSTRDMARFGHLFLAQGCWRGKEIVPAAWVKESTTPYSNTVGDFLPQGLGFYGYMWWVVAENRSFPNTTLPNGSFAAIGAGPQVILVVPSRGVVLVHQAGTDSVCPFGRAGCSYRLLEDSKVLTLLQMIVAAKKR